MIKYIFCVWMAASGALVARSQHNDIPAGSNRSPRKSTISVSIPIQQQANPYSLPRKGEVTGWIDEKMVCKATVKDQRLHGSWQSWYHNGGRLDSGVLINGVPDGEWKVWDSSGRLVAIRQYDADKLLRVKTEMRLDHPKQSFFPLAQLYKQDRQRAKWYLQAGYSFSFANERRSAASLEEVAGQNSRNIAAYQPAFSECLHHGVFSNYFSGGMLKDSGYYKDGLKEGLWIHRNSPAGSWFAGAYKNGMRQYEWKQYDAAGRLIQLIFYNKTGEEERRKKIGQ